MSGTTSEPGSFRDREGRVFYVEGEVYRALSAAALEHWRHLQGSRFFSAALSSGHVVATGEAEGVEAPPAGDDARRWAGVLRHQRIPFVSYPYEWSFSMLRDAALLQLDLLLAALQEDFVLKDSSPYNVQWLGTRPVFIDVASFERLAKGEPWIGYLQFCQLFLYPLMLTAYKDLPFQALLRGRLDGIEPEEADALMSLRDHFRRGVFAHVHLQSRLKRRYANRDESVRAEVQKRGFPKQLIVNNVRSMRALVARLQWRRARSEWSEYGTDHSYSEGDHRAKEAFVRRAAEASGGQLLWDLGCNNGRFTRIAAASFEAAVAMDGDQLAIDRLYLSLKQSQERSDRNILPLVNNLVDPSPRLGWRGLERKSLEDRGRPDLTLALALIHHLVIGANVPLAELVAWLAELGPRLVIEFVGKEDAMVRKLLLNKVDHYADYDQGFFEQQLRRHFRLEERLELQSGTRTLYSCVREIE